MTEKPLEKCPNCGEELEPGWTHCPACRTHTGDTSLISCPNCGRSLKPHWSLCPDCSATLDGDSTPTSSKSEEPPAPPADYGIYLSIMGDQGSETVSSVKLPINEGDELGDRYVIKKLLGHGAFGAVYKAYDGITRNEVALKIVVAQGGGEDANRAMEQILHEYKLRGQIKDVSGIVKSDDPRPCKFKNLSLILLPMELSDEGNLRDWLKNHKDTDKRRNEGISLFKYLCGGVKALHEVNLVHMDLKPENVLISKGYAKITDFGIGRMLGDFYDMNPDQLLHQGIGTPQYMSPEQFRSARQKEIGPASDIYSLGLMLYEILDGNLPFDGSPIELRDKHLNITPPPLKGESAKWWKLVEKCLAKKPEDRYGSIDTLLQDMGRIEQGSTLSVDVSCPNCGHLNSDPNHKTCDKCHGDLKLVFCVCPRCAREVRRDVVECPDCGEQVLSFYLLQERWKKVQKQKDSDPIEAIALLGLILREGAGEYSDQAQATIKDLRTKLSKISPMIKKAESAVSRGKPDEALEEWHNVLSVFPTHSIAQGKIRNLESLLTKIKELKSSARELMDSAEYRKANSKLEESLSVIPGETETRTLLNECNERSQKYQKSFDSALQAQKSKNLKDALKYVESALLVSGKSKEAVSLRLNVQRIISKDSDLVTRAKAELRKAGFSNAQKLLEMIEKDQPNSKELAILKSQLISIRSKYNNSMSEAKQQRESRKLRKALNAAGIALEFCPESSSAESLSKQISTEIGRADRIASGVRKLVDRADFDEAEESIREIEGSNTEANDLDKIKQDLNDRKASYCQSMDLAIVAFEKKNCKTVFEHIMKALWICPNSEEAQELAQNVDEVLKESEENVKNARALIRAADFTEAENLLERTRAINLEVKNLAQLDSDLETTREEYSALIRTARNHYDKKDLDQAENAANQALSFCPDSGEASNLIMKISSDKSHFNEAIKQAKLFITKASFSNALHKVKLAEDIWGKNSAVSTCRGLCEQTKSAYEDVIGSARSSLQSGAYKEATMLCDKALKMCPKSEKARSFKTEIQEAENEHRESVRRQIENDKRRRESDLQKERFARHRRITVALFASVIGVTLGGAIYLLARNVVLGIISLAVIYLGTHIHKEEDTSLWNRIRGVSYRIPAYFLVSSVMIGVTALFVMITTLFHPLLNGDSLPLFRSFSIVVLPLFMLGAVTTTLLSVIAGVGFLVTLFWGDLVPFSYSNLLIPLFTSIGLLIVASIVHIGRETNLYESLYDEGIDGFGIFIMILLLFAVITFIFSFAAYKLIPVETPPQIVTIQNLSIMQPSIATVEVESANMRSGPGTSHDVVDVAHDGDELIYLGSDGNWLNVRRSENGPPIWIYSDLVELAQSQPGAIEIRSSASSAAPLVTHALHGNQYLLISNSGQWVEVSSTDRSFSGWINKNSILMNQAGSTGYRLFYLYTLISAVVLLVLSSVCKID